MIESDCFLETLQYDNSDNVKDNMYFDEIQNRILLTPAYDPVNAEIIVKLGPKSIPWVIKEVLDCFNFPLCVDIDFYFVVRSKKR